MVWEPRLLILLHFYEKSHQPDNVLVIPIIPHGHLVFLDGQSVLPQPINRNAQLLIEAQRACSTCLDTLSTVAISTQSSYGKNEANGGCMVAGFNARVFDEQNVVSGVPVQNFQLQRTQTYGADACGK